MEIIRERANNDFGKGGSSRKGESSDSGYILKVELIGQHGKQKEESRLTPWSKQKEKD